MTKKEISGWRASRPLWAEVGRAEALPTLIVLILSVASGLCRYKLEHIEVSGRGQGVGASLAKQLLFTELPREMVWKLETGPILKSHERADRNQPAIFKPSYCQKPRSTSPPAIL
jgi:hypothetical protein